MFTRAQDFVNMHKITRNFYFKSLSASGTQYSQHKSLRVTFQVLLTSFEKKSCLHSFL